MSQPTKGDYTKLSDSVRELSNYSAETRSDIGYLRQALADIRKDLDKEREQNSALRTQVAVLQSSHDDFKKRWDESDRRRWTVFGVMLAASLTFFANLILLFLKR